MKSFLVPIGGSDTDEPLLETAFAAARPFSGHLNFVHIHVRAGEAIPNIPHAGSARGSAISSLMEELDAEGRHRSAAAARHFRDFCTRSNISVRDVPNGLRGVTASWQEEEGNPLDRIILQARHSDLVVAGRAKKTYALPADFLERLVVDCGCPVLIAGSTPPATLTGTIMVCWKETAEAARAIGAAMPFLANAERVVIASVAESCEDVADAANNVARRLAWNGINAETRITAQTGCDVPDLLSTAARECGADLVVLGAYGHSRMRETLFGGCTLSAIRGAERPVLLMH
jgi:nucleotide-binding universal stress UspA family protein